MATAHRRRGIRRRRCSLPRCGGGDRWALAEVSAARDRSRACWRRRSATRSATRARLRPRAPRAGTRGAGRSTARPGPTAQRPPGRRPVRCTPRQPVPPASRPPTARRCSRAAGHGIERACAGAVRPPWPPPLRRSPDRAVEDGWGFVPPAGGGRRGTAAGARFRTLRRMPDAALASHATDRPYPLSQKLWTASTSATRVRPPRRGVTLALPRLPTTQLSRVTVYTHA